MFEYGAYFLAKPLMSLWLRSSSRSWRVLPRPTDTPSVHAHGVDADHMLLLGAGMAVGYNVLSHELALGGSLARALTALTHRGTDIDIVVDPNMTVPTAITAIGSLQIARFDAIVLTLGGIESLQLMPGGRWLRQVAALLDAIESLAPPSLRVFMIAIPIPAILSLPRIAQRLVGRQYLVLNKCSRTVVAQHPQATFIEFSPLPGNLESLSGRRTYENWAALIAPSMNVALDRQALAADDGVDEQARQHARDELGVVDPNLDERLD